MKGKEELNQQAGSPPLFEHIQPELITLETEEERTKVLLDATPLQSCVLIAAYLLIFVSDGEVTIPLAAAIPEIFLDITNVSFWYTAPAFLGTAGLLLFCYHFNKATKTKKELRITNFGLTLLSVSSYFFLQSSEEPAISFLGVLIFMGLYLFLLQRQTKKRQGML